jgi:hypothetical protein
MRFRRRSSWGCVTDEKEPRAAVAEDATRRGAPQFEPKMPLDRVGDRLQLLVGIDGRASAYRFDDGTESEKEAARL